MRKCSVSQMEGLPEISRGPRRARRREMMHRGAAQPHEDDEGSMSDMRLNLDAARHAALSSFAAVATGSLGSLRQIGTSGFCSCFRLEPALFLYPVASQKPCVEFDCFLTWLALHLKQLRYTLSKSTSTSPGVQYLTCLPLFYSVYYITTCSCARVTHFDFLCSFPLIAQ